jgi:hypothetical protein
MSRCNSWFKYARVFLALFIAAASACLGVRTSTAGETSAQKGEAWVLLQSKSELTGDYDPRRDPEKDLAAAGEEARRSNRKILVVVGGEWCSWCHTMDRFFHDHPELQALRDMSEHEPGKSEPGFLIPISKNSRLSSHLCFGG